MDKEWQIISRFDDQERTFSLFRHAVLSSHAWFDLLNKSKWIEQQLEQDKPERVEKVFSWLSSFIARKRPAAVATLLRSWWGDDSQRVEVLLHWFQRVYWNKPAKSCGTLLDLVEELIHSHPALLFQQQHDNFLVLVLNDWADELPELGGRMFQVVFDAWFIAHPDKLPFGEKKFQIVEQHDSYTLTKFAEKAPAAFLAGATEFLLRCVDMVLAEGREGVNWYAFKYRTYSGYHSRFDQFLSIYRDAFKQIAQQQPTTAKVYLQQLDPHKHECLMHLHLEAIQANPEKFSYRLPDLAQNEMVFNAGYDGAEWLSFAQASKAAFPFLELTKKQKVEQIILTYVPEIKLATQTIQQEGESEQPWWTKEKMVIYYLNSSKYKQWCILETIGEAPLSPAAFKQLQQLRRKFPDRKIEEPNNNIGLQIVGSPVKRDQCRLMSDRHWLSAIDRYNDENDKKRESGHLDGGVRELARELQEATKNNPVRFAKFCLHLPETAHQTYIEHILWGLSEAEAPPYDLVIQAIKFAHQRSVDSFGKDIARLLEKHPHIAVDAEILEIMIGYALHGEANEDEDFEKNTLDRETVSIETLVQSGSNFYIRGINGERGAAWEALGAVLWKRPQVEKRIWEVLEEALDKETLVGIRCAMMKPLIPLFNTNKKRFAAAIRKLIVLPLGTLYSADHVRLSPLITHAGIHLFPSIFSWLPDLAQELVSALLE
ncbi:MAG: hypothetical protein D3923_10045, partial [Candidatus Electrothrix sp. AR3]|nr:hypothetical protein [Candidatus Electrothrix sp. AR3]